MLSLSAGRGPGPPLGALEPELPGASQQGDVMILSVDDTETGFHKGKQV